MAESTILKNKNFIIRVSFTNEVAPSVGKDFFKYETVEIERQGGLKEKYTLNESGGTKKENGEKVSDKSLTEFALNEKRTFYKNLLQNKYKEIENIVVLTGAGSSVGIGVGNKGSAMG